MDRHTNLRRRDLFRAAGGLTLAALAGPRATAQARRPNVVFLLTDDQRWDTLGILGNPLVITPYMDSLARDGTLFENHFVTTAICATSRASFFTGLYERCHGISDFTTPLTPAVYAESYPMRLKKAGYRMGFIGKYGVGKNVDERAPDYDYWRGFPGQGQYYQTDESGNFIHLDTIMGNQALEFLDGCSDREPFCLQVSFKSPHVQDTDPRQFLYDPQYEDLLKHIDVPLPELAAERYFEELPSYLQHSEGRKRWEIRFSTPEKYQASVKGYYRLIHGADVQIGRILKRLREKGFDENTVIVFAGDNGFYLAERGLAGKWYMHEESIRTPLIIRAPGAKKGGRRAEMALNIDVPATILDYAGLKPAPGIQGRSLRPLAEGRHANWRSEWYYSHLFQHPGIPESEGVRAREWAYFHFPQSNPKYEGLYYLKKDPAEKNNLAGSKNHHTQLDRMRKKTSAWKRNLAQWRLTKPWSPPA